MKPRFGIRTFLVVVGVFCVPLAWAAGNYAESKREERLAAQLLIEGQVFELIDSSSFLMCGTGVLGEAHREPVSGLSRIGSLFSPPTFERVTEIRLFAEEYDDQSLKIVQQFPHLKQLWLLDTRVTRSAIDEFLESRPEVEVRLQTCELEGMTFEEAEEDRLLGDEDASP